MNFSNWRQKAMIILHKKYVFCSQNTILISPRYKTLRKKTWDNLNLHFVRRGKNNILIIGVKPYILYIRNKRQQQALARLRVSSHNLYIETGRHSRPFVPSHKRICNYCPLNEIDNEKHFLLKCTFHSVERRSLFKVVNSFLEKEKEKSSLYPDLINGQSIALMRTKDPIVLGVLGKYIYEGFKKRDHLENNSWSTSLITTYLICQWLALIEPRLFYILKSVGLLLHGDIQQF